ncbi:hypothetical protein [Chromobacterium sp. IIBBL 290-4]|uniref:hypothetical protein n=1 Tax=Chromobacterium sp. IIBBL 290-4 TaxID=2953890 RepID=UPI0020B79A82|nr:hypothetical protein [Chromobacterium sp. IIBBL 290-4]UTH74105.1 hypothetical protein NKT35_21585 [Chromobacterium sp. IIBBL 290-4]
MSLLPKIGALLRRCELAQSRCEQALAQLARRDADLEREIAAMKSQQDGMRQLLLAQRPDGEVMARDELFAWQRTQAVLRHRMQDLDFQMDRLREARGEVRQEQEAQTTLRKSWLRKEDKYQRWARTQRRLRRLEMLSREESELEERTKWAS